MGDNEREFSGGGKMGKGKEKRERNQKGGKGKR